MKQTARNWIIQEKIGLISKKDLVQLADDYIANHDEFPDWIMEIAINGSLDRIEELDIILNPIRDSDCILIATQMLALFESGKLDIYQIAAACYRIYLALEWGSMALNHFIWISDELELIEQGVKPREGYEENLKDELSKIINL